jgi:hypothetical protein
VAAQFVKDNITGEQQGAGKCMAELFGRQVVDFRKIKEQVSEFMGDGEALADRVGVLENRYDRDFPERPSKYLSDATS